MNTLIELTSHYGLIKVKGPEAAKFLQGQLTCDIHALNESNPHCLSAYCNPKGRIRAILRVLKISEDFLLQVPIQMLDSTLSELKKYAKFSKVELSNVTEEWSKFGIIAKDKINLSDHAPESILLTYNDNRFEVLIAANKPFNENTFQRGQLNDWLLQDIRSQIPEIWPETKEQFLPHHLNLHLLGSISFTKGCYCGQEIIARMQYLGNIKKHLQHIVLDAENTLPPPGTDLNATTKVISSAWNEQGQVEVLVEAQKV